MNGVPRSSNASIRARAASKKASSRDVADDARSGCQAWNLPSLTGSIIQASSRFVTNTRVCSEAQSLRRCRSILAFVTILRRNLGCGGRLELMGELSSMREKGRSAMVLAHPENITGGAKIMPGQSNITLAQYRRTA